MNSIALMKLREELNKITPTEETLEQYKRVLSKIEKSINIELRYENNSYDRLTDYLLLWPERK